MFDRTACHCAGSGRRGHPERGAAAHPGRRCGLGLSNGLSWATGTVGTGSYTHDPTADADGWVVPTGRERGRTSVWNRAHPRAGGVCCEESGRCGWRSTHQRRCVDSRQENVKPSQLAVDGSCLLSMRECQQERMAGKGCRMPHHSTLSTSAQQLRSLHRLSWTRSDQVHCSGLQ